MLKNILVALDDSDISERVMESVLKLILPSDGKVILCHVFPTSTSEMEHPADRPYSESSAIHIYKSRSSYNYTRLSCLLIAILNL